MGKTKQLVDDLISKRSKGVEALAINTRMKLLMKGIDAKKITHETPDDDMILQKIYQLATEFNIKLD